jgi:hypothetical protein
VTRVRPVRGIPIFKEKKRHSQRGREMERDDLLDVKIVHIFVVLVASLVGMTTPVYFANSASIDVMFVLRSFATGASL